MFLAKKNPTGKIYKLKVESLGGGGGLQITQEIFSTKQQIRSSKLLHNITSSLPLHNPYNNSPNSNKQKNKPKRKININPCKNREYNKNHSCKKRLNSFKPISPARNCSNT